MTVIGQRQKQVLKLGVRDLPVRSAVREERSFGARHQEELHKAFLSQLELLQRLREHSFYFTVAMAGLVIPGSYVLLVLVAAGVASLPTEVLTILAGAVLVDTIGIFGTVLRLVWNETLFLRRSEAPRKTRGRRKNHTT